MFKRLYSIFVCNINSWKVLLIEKRLSKCRPKYASLSVQKTRTLCILYEKSKRKLMLVRGFCWCAVFALTIIRKTRQTTKKRKEVINKIKKTGFCRCLELSHLKRIFATNQKKVLCVSKFDSVMSNLGIMSRIHFTYSS